MEDCPQIVPVNGSHPSPIPLIHPLQPEEPTCPCGPSGHEPNEAFLLKDDTGANEEAGEEGEAHTDVEAILLPDPLLPGGQGGIVGLFRADASHNLTEDLLRGAVEADYGTWRKKLVKSGTEVVGMV